MYCERRNFGLLNTEVFELHRGDREFQFFLTLPLMIALKEWTQTSKQIYFVILFLSVWCNSENNSFSKELQKIKFIQNQIERHGQVSQWG
jgi:hypothetical protein